jgi:hypothetical protein
MNARNLTIFKSIAVLGLGGYFIFRYLRNKRIDERVVSEAEALQMLEEAKLGE